MSYQIQQYIAAAIETVLASGQSFVTTANIQKNRDTDTSTVPRFEIEVGGVSRASAQMMIVPSVGPIYGHFSAEATVALVTERGGSIDHAAAVARTRYLFSQEAQKFISPVVTAFEVLALENTAETQEIDEEAREDWSKLAFRFEIGLLPGQYTMPGVGPSIRAAGAGTAGANGVYSESGTFGGRPQYVKTGYVIQWDSAEGWWDLVDTGTGLSLYASSAPPASSDVLGAWTQTGTGIAPPPTVTAG